MFSVLMFSHSTPVSGRLTPTVKRQIQPQCEHMLILQRPVRRKCFLFTVKMKPNRLGTKLEALGERDLIGKSYFMVCFGHLGFNFSLA